MFSILAEARVCFLGREKAVRGILPGHGEADQVDRFVEDLDLLQIWGVSSRVDPSRTVASLTLRRTSWTMMQWVIGEETYGSIFSPR